MISLAFYFGMVVGNPDAAGICGFLAFLVICLFACPIVDKMPDCDGESYIKSFLRSLPIIITVLSVVNILFTGVGLIVNWNLFYVWGFTLAAFVEGMMLFTVVPLVLYGLAKASSGIYNTIEKLTEKAEDAFDRVRK